MSVVTILVYLSQTLRALSIKIKNKTIAAIKDRIAILRDEQVEVEAQRSKAMIDLHNKFYADDAKLSAERDAEIAAINAKFDALQDKLAAKFNEDKAVIATLSQAASNDLKRELAMLEFELDNLTK